MLQTYISLTNQYKVYVHECADPGAIGELWIENPSITVDILENGGKVYYSRAIFALPTKEDAYTFTGISSTRSESIELLNRLLNEKVSANHTNFLLDNYFFLSKE